MKRFIRYLYEYEDGKRIRNVGFVKVETGNEETTLRMQAKGFGRDDDRKLVLYLFYEENGELISVYEEKMVIKTLVLNYCLTYTREDYYKIQGVLLVTDSGRRIAATWDDKQVDVSRVKKINSAVVENGHKKENVGHDTQEIDEVSPHLTKKQKRITKIQRQEISKLPHCEWNLANNQFLVHGYNNYHYLVLIEDENVLKLGVPGIYHIKEEKYAQMFGFGEFQAADETFGYWCRPVKRRQSKRH